MESMSLKKSESKSKKRCKN